jgi:hypothetical protein
MDETHAAHDAAPSTGHEERDIRFWPITISGAALLLVTLIVFVLMRALFVFYDKREARLSPPANPLAVEYGEPLPPKPRLQSDPIKDLVQLRAAEDAILNSYAWVDPQAGVVRIPIARALEILAHNPPPSRPAAGDRQ